MFFVLLTIELILMISGTVLITSHSFLYGGILLGIGILLLLFTIYFYKEKVNRWFKDCAPADCFIVDIFDCDCGRGDCDCTP